jgi:predicted MPP superfamily phosphohydrolase
MRPFSGELIIFLLVSSSVMAVIYGYVGWKFVTHTRLSGVWRRAVWFATMALFLLNPIGFMSGFFLGRSAFPEVLSWISYIGLGFMSLAAAFLLIWDLTRLSVYFATRLKKAFRPPRFVRETSVDAINRREFLIQSVNIGLIGAAALLGGYGVYEARRRPSVVQVEVPICDLPRALDGFHIAQITDMHVGPTIKHKFVEAVVEGVNSLRADIVAVTGDLVDGTVEHLGYEVAPLQDLKAADGVFFITGNHEYYSGVVQWMKEIPRLGLTVLNNEHRLIRRAGASLLLAGVTDYSAGSMIPSHKSDPKAAIAGAPEADVKILLAHQPRSIFAAAQAGYDLQISGHTHGGQYFPGNLLVALAQPYIAGLHLYKKTWIYISRGTGYWGPPLRLGAPSEITSIRLVSARGGRPGQLWKK